MSASSPTRFTTCAFGIAPSNTTMSFIKGVVADVKNCLVNVALPTMANDLNPFSPGIGTVADVTSQMSQASLAGAASWSVERGLTVPLRSSIVRAGISNAEAFGKVSGIFSLLAFDYALADAAYAEYKGC